MVPPSLAVLADPPIRQIDATAMDYFIIEMVNTLRDSSAVAAARSKKIEQEMIEAGLLPPPPAPLSLATKVESARDSVTSLPSRTAAKLGLDEEEEGVRARLEGIGMHIGANFTERYVSLPVYFAKFMIADACRIVVYAAIDHYLEIHSTS